MNKDLIKKLNAKTPQERLNALTELKKSMGNRQEGEGYTNNHVHSKYSFSPYSPTRIVYEAYIAGLDTVGILDHDSIAGAKEFIEAGKIMGIATTVGFEIRTDWSDTPFSNVTLNNPDQKGCAYICVHGVPHQNIDEAEVFLADIRNARNNRNAKMVECINKKIKDISLDFEKDVVPISYSVCGGSITERHILYALGEKIIEKAKTREEIVEYLTENLGMQLSDLQIEYIEDKSNEMYDYDLLNILKSNFINNMYIDAEHPEILPIADVIDFAHKIGAIPSYAYLGDVGNSVTGDKKAQNFEDDYLAELMEYNKKINFDAIAYMPSRNTTDQLYRLQNLCDKYGFFQISGEDINQPRQSFICKQLMEEEYIHLIDNTWALIGHELMASKDIALGLFAGENKDKKLTKKIDTFAEYGFSAYNEYK